LKPTLNLNPERSTAARLPFPRGTSGAGFTLIELILVLGLLLIVVGISFPTLKNFFRGRALDSEARRFLSLTRYAQSRAAAEGLPMVVWIDPQEQTYGMQVETGFVDEDRRAVEYDIDETLLVEVTAPPAPVPMAGLSLPGARQRPLVKNASLPAIRINAEGHLEDTSPEAIVFRQGERNEPAMLCIVQSGNRLNYEISASAPPSLGR
jgi:type II secretory pathway pseudopilin PulG